MDRQKAAWFFGWLVTRKGSDTSGNYGHKGVKNAPWGKGGSAPGGGHAAMGIAAGTPTEEVKEKIQARREEMKAKKEKPKVGTPANLDDGIDARGLKFFFGDDPDAFAIGPATLSDRVDSWVQETAKAISEQSGVVSYRVKDAIQVWGTTSNDSDLRALSLQEAVSEEFGIPLSSWQEEKLAGVRFSTTREPIADREDERAILRAMYDRTQEEFQKAGYKPGDTIRLFRGVTTITDAKRGETVGLEQNAMSSWSINNEVALFFAKKGVYAENKGIILSMEVPIESILSVAARTGLGEYNEGEFVVLGVPGNQAMVQSVVSNDG